jgi:hypothetical protein
MLVLGSSTNPTPQVNQLDLYLSGEAARRIADDLRQATPLSVAAVYQQELKNAESVWQFCTTLARGAAIG